MHYLLSVSPTATDINVLNGELQNSQLTFLTFLKLGQREAEMTPFSLDLKLPRGIFVLSMKSLHICYPISSVFSRKMKEREEEELGMKKYRQYLPSAYDLHKIIKLILS